jgi:hypothetical protein
MSEPRPSTDVESAPLLTHNESDDEREQAYQPGPWQKLFKLFVASPDGLGSVEKGLLGLAFALFLAACIGFGLFAGEFFEHRLPTEQTTVTATATATTTVASPAEPTSPPQIYPNVLT